MRRYSRITDLYETRMMLSAGHSVILGFNPHYGFSQEDVWFSGISRRRIFHSEHEGYSPHYAVRVKLKEGVIL